MAKTSVDDKELRRACQAAIEGSSQKIVFSIRVIQSRGVWTKLGRNTVKPRVLALSVKSKGQHKEVFLLVLQYNSGDVLEPAKLYKLKHLSKVEVITNDTREFTFILGFDDLKRKSIAPPQWTVQNIDDRNCLLLAILNVCKDVIGRPPKVVGIDVVEMDIWAKKNTPTVTAQRHLQDQGPLAPTMIENDFIVTVEKELVSNVEEEEDMEALLETYFMGIGEAELFSEKLKRELLALETANVHAILESQPMIEEVLQGLETITYCVDDMEDWLGTFNQKLTLMREDIESVETLNNKLEMESLNNKVLIEELDKLLERLRVPSEYVERLTGGSFDEARMVQNIEACEWLNNAIRGLQVPNLDISFANIRAVKEKRAELVKITAIFVRRGSQFLINYFTSLVDFMISDKTYFSKKGQFKAPDHADLRNKCKPYARLLQHLKSMDKNCLGSIRKAYCSSLNLLLRRETREFAYDLRANAKASRTTASLESSTASEQNPRTSTVSDAYAKMLTTFIPLIVDESSYFARFMCFGVFNGSKSGTDINNDDELGIMDIDENDSKTGKSSAELRALNESLQDLLDGIQEDFYALVDWAYKNDPYRCISMYGITEKVITGQKADPAEFVHMLLEDLQSRISMQFSLFVDKNCIQIEKNEYNVQPKGVLSCIPRLATLATRMERYIQGDSRELVNQAYAKLAETIFATLEKTAEKDAVLADVFLIENYAAFQISTFELANCVPTIDVIYLQAIKAYEEACARHTYMIVYYQFEQLFLFARRIDELVDTMTPKQIQLEPGLSKVDFQNMVESNLSEVDNSIIEMYTKLQKNFTSKELLPFLWQKCKEEFMDKYESFAQLAIKVYPTEVILSVADVREIMESL